MIITKSSLFLLVPMVGGAKAVIDVNRIIHVFDRADKDEHGDIGLEGTCVVRMSSDGGDIVMVDIDMTAAEFLDFIGEILP